MAPAENRRPEVTARRGRLTAPATCGKPRVFSLTYGAS
nr:MAG TPA: hypothetical protein [Caudoviricetes sp.]